MSDKPLQIYIDGQFYSQEDAKISVFDHGLLYGDGVFEGIRFYNDRVFRLEQHIDRLFRLGKAIHLTIPATRAEVCEMTLETIRRNDLHDGYIRLVVTRGVGSLGLSPYHCKQASLIVIASTISLYRPKNTRRAHHGDLRDAPAQHDALSPRGEVAQLPEQRHGESRGDGGGRGGGRDVSTPPATSRNAPGTTFSS